MAVSVCKVSQYLRLYQGTSLRTYHSDGRGCNGDSDSGLSDSLSKCKQVNSISHFTFYGIRTTVTGAAHSPLEPEPEPEPEPDPP